MKRIITHVVAFILVLTLVGCGNQSTEEKLSDQVIKIGVVGSNEAEIWEHVKNEVAKENIKLEIVVFTEYSQPNPALTNGDIDLNAFQHYIFLDAYNHNQQQDLAVIGETFISPLAVYSNKVKDISEIYNGDVIAIPNDPTNGGRALLLLQDAGLIKIDASKGDMPTLNDIVENSLNLKILELDASQTARSLDDVKASIINGGMAVDAGLEPKKDAIFIEKLNATSKPYINVIVARDKDKENPLFKRIVEVFRTDTIGDAIHSVGKGAIIPIWEIE